MCSLHLLSSEPGCDNCLLFFLSLSFCTESKLHVSLRLKWSRCTLNDQRKIRSSHCRCKTRNNFGASFYYTSHDITHWCISFFISSALLLNPVNDPATIICSQCSSVHSSVWKIVVLWFFSLLTKINALNIKQYHISDLAFSHTWPKDDSLSKVKSQKWQRNKCLKS